MGGTRFSDAVYADRMDTAAKTGTVFTHDHDIKAGRVADAMHDKVNPRTPNKAGKIVRESLDSDAHPESTAVAVLFDVTGSMRRVPEIFIKKFGQLMALLVKKGHLQHPHILFGAIGDATPRGESKFPLQLGQFEAGNEMDESLSLIVPEGGGGGHITESYELGMYFLAKKTVLDCLGKRGKKGYCFITGDEIPYPVVNKDEVERIIGDKLQQHILTSAQHPQAGSAKVAGAEGDILEELREKFEVFWIMPGGTSHWNDQSVVGPLKEMFGQHFLQLENPDDVCELIATTIAVTEGYELMSIKSDLRDIGADHDAVDRATTAVTKYANTRALAKGATATSALAVAGSDAVERL